jgi:predicted DNA-binding transcriptional regulator AlpA
LRASDDSIETGLIALPKAMAIADCSKSHIYNLIKRGKFPAPAIRCGPRFTRWRASDVLAWASDPQAYIDANEVTR